MGRQLTEQYEKAVGGMKAVFVFGAMILTVQQNLSTRGEVSGGRGKKGGVSGWLTEFAPTVPQGTAYRFRDLAEGLQKEFQLGKKCDMVRLLTAPVEELKKGEQQTREKIEKFVEGKSQRQLLFEFGYGETKDKGGKKVKKDAPLTPEEEEAAARLEATTFYHSLHRDLFAMTETHLKKMHYLPIVSDKPAEEIDLHHLELALAKSLQAVRDELTTRGEKPSTKIK
jgi:hypothetical protein